MKLSLKSSMTASKLAQRLGGGLFYNGEPLYYNGELLVYNGDANSVGLPDPENGLTVTLSYAPGDTITSGLTDRNNPVVWAFDITGLNGSAGGVIYGQGGSSLGSYIGFRNDGTFVARCGVGASPWDVDTAYLELANGSDLIKGTGTLVVEFVAGTPTTLRVFWNRVDLTPLVNGASNAQWTGSGSGGYLLVDQGPSGEEKSILPVYETASDLRYYENQTINI